MKKITVWVKQHPYLLGGLVVGLIVLYFVFKSFLSSGSSGASAGTTVIGSAGGSDQTAAAQVANNQTAAAAQVAQGQADDQLAAVALAARSQDAQTSAARDVGLQNILTAGQVAQGQTQGAVDIAGINANAAVSINATTTAGNVNIAGIGAGRDVAVAGIAGDVAKVQANDALTAVQTNDATQSFLGTLAQSLGITQSNNSLAATKNTNDDALAATINTNDAAKTVALAQNDTNLKLGSQYITTQGDIAQTTLADETTIANTKATLVNETIKGLNAGVYNKGGEGGANQVSVLGAIFGQPSVGAPAQATEASNSASQNAFLASLSKSISGAASSIFA